MRMRGRREIRIRAVIFDHPLDDFFCLRDFLRDASDSDDALGTIKEAKDVVLCSDLLKHSSFVVGIRGKSVEPRTELIRVEMNVFDLNRRKNVVNALKSASDI